MPAELTYSPTYDNDGNELTNGAGQTYTWDAKNELMSIVYTAGANSGNHTEFTYDALGHRISIVERTGTTVGSGTVTSTKQLVWNGSTIAEERNVSNAVTKKFFAQGEQIGSSSYYYTFDHLGSVREMTDSSGSIQARYDYDPYGRATPVGTITTASDFQYAGYYEHAGSGLNLTLFRAYDPNTAKWLSRDPLPDAEMSQGPNLYEYVKNDPIDMIDPLGLSPTDYGPMGVGSGMAGNAGGSSGNCPCGQHMAWSRQMYHDTRSTLTLGDYGSAAGGIAWGLGTALKVGSAATVGKVLSTWNGGVTIGALLGSWECVPN